MFFLLRRLICIGLVYAMASSDRALNTPTPTPSPTSASVGVSDQHAAALPHAIAHHRRLAETAKAIVLQGVDTLGASARNHCLAAPQGCMATLNRLNGLRTP